MNQARIEQLGTPEDLYDRPVSRFAAGFIGHSNLLEGRFVGERRLRVENATLDLDAHQGCEGSEGLLLVRPEAARLTAPEDGLLQGVVDECVFLGSDLRAQVRLPSGKAFNVRCPRQLTVRPGDAVGITWDPRQAALLPAEVRP